MSIRFDEKGKFFTDVISKDPPDSGFDSYKTRRTPKG